QGADPARLIVSPKRKRGKEDYIPRLRFGLRPIEMDSVTIRLLPFATADGAHNMAADEVLLESAATGAASLRFYGWSEPTLSLGYFQPEVTRQGNPLLAGLPYVRRPTGGMTLVHHHELTYALALPTPAKAQPWLCRMHGIIGHALRR